MENIEKTIVYWGYLSCHQKILSSKCGKNERRATILTHLFLFALLLNQSGDVEKNLVLLKSLKQSTASAQKIEQILSLFI